jgi:hypothetical protein
MRFAVAAAALGVFVALAGDTGKNHRQDNSRLAACDDVGKCTTISAISSTLVHREGQSEVKNRATPQHQSQALDANGNPAGIVISRKTKRACSRWNCLCWTFPSLYRRPKK